MKNSHNKTIRESSKESIVTDDLKTAVSITAGKNASGVYHQELIHPARYGIAKETVTNGYSGILSKSLHGMPDPGNGANPEVKQDPKQECFTQSRAIVRRLILRLHFIFSVATWEAHSRVYVLSREKKKETRGNRRPEIPAWEGLTAGTQAGQLTCGRTISGQSSQTWHSPRGTVPRPVDHEHRGF